MKKLNPVVIILSSVVAVIVLFGGWFTYNKFAVESPLAELINEQPSVEKATIELTDSELAVNLEVNSDINIREVMNVIYTEGKSMLGNRDVNLNVNEQSSPELDAWWSTVLFDVAEAMELKEYSRIPEALNDKAAALDGLQVTTDIDEHNVYIKLIHKDAMKIVMLPRTPSQMGVPTNV